MEEDEQPRRRRDVEGGKEPSRKAMLPCLEALQREPLCRSAISNWLELFLLRAAAEHAIRSATKLLPKRLSLLLWRTFQITNMMVPYSLSSYSVIYMQPGEVAQEGTITGSESVIDSV